MSDTDYFSKYRAYFLSQKDAPQSKSATHPPFVTISRQSGSGAETVAHLLAGKLNAKRRENEQPWMVFDKNLIGKMLEDQHLPQAIAKLVREDTDTTVEALVGELLGLNPSMWTLFHHTSDTILKLARLGRCIIVGRGASVITEKLQGGLRVRLVAPDAARIEHLKKHFHYDEKAAAQYMNESDSGRRRYIKANFDRDIEDPLLYHAVFNTGLTGFEGAANMLETMLASGIA